MVKEERRMKSLYRFDRTCTSKRINGFNDVRNHEGMLDAYDRNRRDSKPRGAAVGNVSLHRVLTVVRPHIDNALNRDFELLHSTT